jgi:hypothetical protein
MVRRSDSDGAPVEGLPGGPGDSDGGPARLHRMRNAAFLGVGGLAVIALVASSVLWWPRGEDQQLRLEPVTVAVPDAFMQSVAVDEASLPDGLVTPDIASRTLPERDPAASPGPLRLGRSTAIAGALPGLFGGTRDERTCDPDQLVTFLEKEPQKASAWAGVHDIDPEEIDEFVGSLTPLVLTRDTHVTNHGFRDGEAYRIQSVLEAGTAVMVDDRGLPAVKCGCGNPLLPPATIAPDVEVRLTGEPWSGWHPDRVVVIGVDTRVEVFVTVDLAGGEPFLRSVGSGPDQDQSLPDDELCRLVPDALACSAPEPEPEPEPESDPEPNVIGTHDASWQDTAVEYRGRDVIVPFSCPAGGEPSTVWGTDTYSDDSSVCTAGVHAGVIDLERGGTVRIQIVAGADQYVGTERHGIQTLDWEVWPGSFIVVGGTPNEPPVEQADQQSRACPDYAFTDGSGHGMFAIETFGIQCDELTGILDRIMADDSSDGFTCQPTDAGAYGGGRCDHADGRWFTWVDGN